MSNQIFDVAIVGCGPAGATLANLLGQCGISVLVLERDAAIYSLPRAAHFDGEVMRVLETTGLRLAVESISRPGLKGMYFNNAAGETLLIRGGTSENGPHGCATNHYFHQPELEALLREGLQRYAHVQLRTQHEVIAIEDGAQHVTLQVLDVRSDSRDVVKARYVVGCDGARSLVRKVIGAPMVDLGSHQPWLVFDVRLKEEVPALPDHTVQHCDPARPMTYCNVTGNRRRWEIMLMPGDDPTQIVKPEAVWSLVSRWLRPEQAEVERAVVYTFHSLIVQSWRKGRLFLAGDAAHQTPPFLGQGMCAAIRDAANLAWKLEAVLAGRAGDGLLDTYASERLPHVQAFIELAVELGEIIQTTDPEAARARDEKFKTGSPTLFEFPTPKLGTGVWQGDHPAVARIFPQPRLSDGRLLDIRLGYRFAVIGHSTLLNGVNVTTQSIWRANEVVTLSACEHPLLQAWLAQHDVQAVVLRPDRYVMGVARTSDELDAISSIFPSVTNFEHDVPFAMQ